MFDPLVKKALSWLSKISLQQEEVIGVDITPESIYVSQLDNDKSEWVLAKFAHKQVEDGTDYSSLEEHPEIYANALKRLVSLNKIDSKNAAISIPVSRAIIKALTLPLMTDEELSQAIETGSLWENVIQLSEAPEDYSIFWQVIQRSSQENTMDLLFVASKVEDIEMYIDIARQAGLNPVVVDVRCFTVRKALELDQELIQEGVPVVLLEFGGHENYVLILKDDTPYISDLYVSDRDQAMLGEVGCDPKEFKQIIGRLARQIAQVLTSYQGKFNIIPIKQILATSTYGNYHAFIDQLRDCLPAVEILPFDPLKTLTVPENIRHKLNSEPNLSVLASSIGLATRKLDIFGYYQYVTGTRNINLMPDRNNIRAEEKMKWLSKWGLGGVAVVLLLAGVWSFFGNRVDIQEMDPVLKEYQALELARSQKQIELIELQSKQAEINRTLNVTKDIRSNQGFMYEILSTVNSSVPKGISLTSITFDGTNNNYELKGLSLSDQNILTLIEKLEESPLIVRSSLLNMSVDKNEKYVIKAFVIRCVLADKESAPVDESTS